MSDHLHCNIFMSHISSNTSVTKNADTWYVGETSISTSSLLLREIGKIFTGELIFSMSRFPSWLEVNFLTSLKKTTQKCSNSHSYFPACHWHGKGSSHRQIRSRSHVLPLGVAAQSQGCQPHCPCSRLCLSLGTSTQCGQRSWPTTPGYRRLGVHCEGVHEFKCTSEAQPVRRQGGFTCASLPQKQQEILSDDTSWVWTLSRDPKQRQIYFSIGVPLLAGAAQEFSSTAGGRGGEKTALCSLPFLEGRGDKFKGLLGKPY